MAQKGHDTHGGSDSANPCKGTVLLVDEDRNDLHHHSDVLRTLGYQVRTCGSYDEGVKLLDSDAFGLTIVSQGTRNFEGRCVLERANQIGGQLPVLVTAYCLDIPCYLEAMVLGAVDYLVAPVTKEDLGRAVQAHLRAHPSKNRPS